MKKLLATAALSALMIAGSASAGTIKLSLVYIGDSTAASAPLPSATANLSSLTTNNFSSAASYTNGAKHLFAVDMVFTPGDASQDFFESGYDVTTPAGTTKIDRTGSTVATVNKYYAYNPLDSDNTGDNEFKDDSDAGTAGDLLGILVDQTVASDAAAFQSGEAGRFFPTASPNGTAGSNRLGYFYVTTSASSPGTTITLSETFGNNVGSWINNTTGTGTQTTTSAGFSSANFTFPALGVTPEPASLSLLGFGALGLIRRRRQA